MLLTLFWGCVWCKYSVDWRWVSLPSNHFLYCYCSVLLLTLYSCMDNNYATFLIILGSIFWCINMITMLDSCIFRSISLDLIYWFRFMTCSSERHMKGCHTGMSCSNQVMRNGWIACPTRGVLKLVIML